MTSLYANGTSSANITTSDTFNDQLILQGINALEKLNNIPFDDGSYYMFIAPDQWMALLQDTNTRNDLRWAEPMRLVNGPTGLGVSLTGERGQIHGVRVIVTNYVATNTENSVPVFKALLCAPRWAAIAWKRRPEVVVDPTLYDMGRERRFGVTADFDIELIHYERAMVLCSA
jgi:hypothetical protein